MFAIFFSLRPRSLPPANLLFVCVLGLFPAQRCLFHFKLLLAAP
jgi:hypothetical protein